MTTFTRRAVDGGYWVLAIALLCVYCVLQSYGERERHAVIALFLHRGTAAEIPSVEPTDPRPLDAVARP
jgi:hypothetical protein